MYIPEFISELSLIVIDPLKRLWRTSTDTLQVRKQFHCKAWHEQEWLSIFIAFSSLDINAVSTPGETETHD